MSRRIPSKEEWAATAPVRNPGERAALCALAHLAHRESGQAQAPRLRLASAATMGVATFRRHAAALAEAERGLIAVSHPRTPNGDHDETIYTLVGWLKLRGLAEPENTRNLEHLPVSERTQMSAVGNRQSAVGALAECSGEDQAPRGAQQRETRSAVGNRQSAVGALGDRCSETHGRLQRRETRAPTRSGHDKRQFDLCAGEDARCAPGRARSDGRFKSEPGGLDIVAWADQIEQRADDAHKESLSPEEGDLGPLLSSAARNASANRQIAAAEASRTAGPALAGTAGADDDAAALKRWFRTLTAVAGPGLCDPAKEPRLHTTSGELIAWRNAGVDLELDAVPIVRARTAKPRARPIWGWGALREDVLEAAARRKAKLKLPEFDHARTCRDGAAERPMRYASAAEREAADAEARRRSLARVLDELELRSTRASAHVADEAGP